jgi:hypothetical protein
MLHSWQDYYAHALRLDSPFRGDPGQLSGNPDVPSADTKPASWGGYFNWGEHGYDEPPDRAADNGQSRWWEAAGFSLGKLQSLFGDWWAKCECRVCRK